MNVLLLCLQFHVEKKVRKTNVGDKMAIGELDPFNNTFCEIARDVVGGTALSVLTIDSVAPAEVLDDIRARIDASGFTAVDLTED